MTQAEFDVNALLDIFLYVSVEWCLLRKHSGKMIDKSLCYGSWVHVLRFDHPSASQRANTKTIRSANITFAEV